MFKIEKAQFVMKKWGSEKIFSSNKLFAGKLLTVQKGCYCSLHSHPIKIEEFYVLKGSFEVQLLEGIAISETSAKPTPNAKIKTVFLKKGDSLFINNGLFHRFIGTGSENIIIEVSTEDSSNDNVRIDPTYPNGCLNVDKLNVKIEKYK